MVPTSAWQLIAQGSLDSSHSVEQVRSEKYNVNHVILVFSNMIQIRFSTLMQHRWLMWVLLKFVDTCTKCSSSS